MTTITKATTKGQITLPASWRKQFDTNTFVIQNFGSRLEIKPVDKKKLKKAVKWITVFNAKRDNGGKGIEAGELVKILEKLTKK